MLGFLPLLNLTTAARSINLGPNFLQQSAVKQPIAGAGQRSNETIQQWIDQNIGKGVSIATLDAILKRAADLIVKAAEAKAKYFKFKEDYDGDCISIYAFPDYAHHISAESVLINYLRTGVTNDDYCGSKPSELKVAPPKLQAAYKRLWNRREAAIKNLRETVEQASASLKVSQTARGKIYSCIDDLSNAIEPYIRLKLRSLAGETKLPDGSPVASYKEYKSNKISRNNLNLMDWDYKHATYLEELFNKVDNKYSEKQF
jgi:hypothetical protein